MPPLFISYYTVGTPYRQEADALRESLEAWGLDYRIYGRPCRGSWQANTQQKAEVVAEAMADGRAVVWLDADARVERPPTLLHDLTCDFAAHWLGNEMLSGTIYFGATEAARLLVKAWQTWNRENPNGRHGDQQNLQNAVEHMTGLDVFRLPPEYTWIQATVDTPEDISFRRYGRRAAVIRHTQASRRMRK